MIYVVFFFGIFACDLILLYHKRNKVLSKISLPKY